MLEVTLRRVGEPGELGGGGTGSVESDGSLGGPLFGSTSTTELVPLPSLAAEAWLPQGSATSGWVLAIRGTRYSTPTPSQSAKKAILGRSTSRYPS